MKTSVLVKIDTIINTHNSEELKSSFINIKNHYLCLKRIIEEKKKKGTSFVFNFFIRKNKNISEKSFRSLVNFVNEKKLVEMQIKMLSRVLAKIVSKKFYSYL